MYIACARIYAAMRVLGTFMAQQRFFLVADNSTRTLALRVGQYRVPSLVSICPLTVQWTLEVGWWPEQRSA